MAATDPEPMTVPEGVATRLSLLLVRLSDEVQRRAEPLLAAEAGLTGRQYFALAVLDGDRPASQQELATLMCKAPPLVVAVVDELEAAGYVERSRDPDDRRRTRVTITKAGSRALARGDAIAARLERDLGEPARIALADALGAPVA